MPETLRRQRRKYKTDTTPYVLFYLTLPWHAAGDKGGCRVRRSNLGFFLFCFAWLFLFFGGKVAGERVACAIKGVDTVGR